MHRMGNKKVAPCSPNLQHGTRSPRPWDTKRRLFFPGCCSVHASLPAGDHRVMLAAGPRWKGTTTGTFSHHLATSPQKMTARGHSREPGLYSLEQCTRWLSLPSGLKIQHLSFPQPVLQPGDGLFFWINFSRKQIFKQPLNLSPSTARMVPAGESSQLPSFIPQHGTAPASGEWPWDGDQKAENAG